MLTIGFPAIPERCRGDLAYELGREQFKIEGRHTKYYAKFPADLGPILTQRWYYWLDRSECYTQLIDYENFFSILEDLQELLAEIIRLRGIHRPEITLFFSKLNKCIQLLVQLQVWGILPLSNNTTITNAINELRRLNGVNLNLINVPQFSITIREQIASLEAIITPDIVLRLLFDELDSSSQTISARINYLSDLLNWFIAIRNPRYQSNPYSFLDSLFDIRTGYPQVESLSDFRNETNQFLITLLSHPLVEGHIYYALSDLNVHEVLPVDRSIHIFRPGVDDSYQTELEEDDIVQYRYMGNLPWGRVIVNARDRYSAEIIAKNDLERWLEEICLISTYNIGIGPSVISIIPGGETYSNLNPQQMEQRFPIPQVLLCRHYNYLISERNLILRNLRDSNEINRFLLICKWIRKAHHSHEDTDKIAQLWIAFEVINGNRIRMAIPQILTLLLEIKNLQFLYEAFQNSVLENFEWYELNLTGTPLEGFPRNINVSSLVTNFHLIRERLRRPFLEHRFEEFTQATPLWHRNRLNQKSIELFNFLHEIKFLRNAIFHSGIINLRDMGKKVTQFADLLNILINSYKRYIKQHPDTTIEHFLAEWCHLFDSIQIRLITGENYAILIQQAFNLY